MVCVAQSVTALVRDGEGCPSPQPAMQTLNACWQLGFAVPHLLPSHPGTGLQEHPGGRVQAALGHDHARPPPVQPLLGRPQICAGAASAITASLCQSVNGTSKQIGSCLGMSCDGNDKGFWHMLTYACLFELLDLLWAGSLSSSTQLVFPKFWGYFVSAGLRVCVHMGII